MTTRAGIQIPRNLRGGSSIRAAESIRSIQEIQRAFENGSALASYGLVGSMVSRAPERSVIGAGRGAERMRVV
jgi:hypothetical protein